MLLVVCVFRGSCCTSGGLATFVAAAVCSTLLTVAEVVLVGKGRGAMSKARSPCRFDSSRWGAATVGNVFIGSTMVVPGSDVLNTVGGRVGWT